jgi:hypothetical protein
VALIILGDSMGVDILILLIVRCVNFELRVSYFEFMVILYR